MAPVVPDEAVFTYDKKAKEKVRKCGTSAKRKAVQLGKAARVFSAVIHFNPTYGQLDGAVYIPEGQSMPDVNQFLEKVVNGTHELVGQRRGTRRRRKTTDAEPSQILMETGNTRMVEVASSMKEEPDFVVTEVAGTNGVTNEDADAPHEIEADEHCVAIFGNTASDCQRDEAPSGKDPISLADHRLPTETAQFGQDVCGTEDYVMGGTDTASAINQSEEDSFVGLLEFGLHDLLEMEGDGNCAPVLGPVDESGLGKLEGGSTDINSDQERSQMEKTGGEGLMEARAETSKAALKRGKKTPRTPPTSARVCHATRSSQRIQRFLYLVFKHIRLARQQGDFHTGHAHQTTLGAHQ
ncbi:hypothetical protein COL26b_014372 [Colletotrichum chrysophilum]|uniref:uncharacterized protein n=1 Tax=Colletotrichum chrysophilum TaxID=1836956 RepID=UPI0023003F9F|nr:uncharacterized protein COL26b_014372 [Colletotrichum chrysophilum]KAJ0359366.1 hypothetical protein COL26b_014372 [Colletotrichum chrysophilum]